MKYIIARCLVILCILTVVSTILPIPVLAQAPLAESYHPYANNYEYTWTISAPGANQIRIHFSKIGIERGDNLDLLDKEGDWLAGWSGTEEDFWTEWYTGDTLKVRLETDIDGTDFGFTVDQLETRGGIPQPASAQTQTTPEITVEPDIVISPQSGEAGTTVTVSGTGFSNRQKVIIWFTNIGVAQALTDSAGTFTVTFDVPAVFELGIYEIEVEDDDGNSDTAKFTVTVPPTPTPTPPPSATSGSLNPASSGPIGTSLIVSGTGFEAGKNVTVKYDDDTVATAAADSNGILVAAFKAPASKHGDHTITASDGTNTLKLTFTVESNAPKTPPPLLPEMGVKAKSPILFDWEDVTDESSPVTYTLQIATDKAFTASAIALEKTGLTASEYTLSEGEELKLAGKETPYYWRIRATDAALNESEWTGAGEFYVTEPFAFPIWAIYAMCILVLILIGYFTFSRWRWRRFRLEMEKAELITMIDKALKEKGK